MPIGYDLAAWLAGEKDLEVIQTAISRERVIRDGMARTGEDRQTIIDFMDAHRSMDQEAVLSLTDGEPTTLADGLQRYVDGLAARWPDDMDLDQETVVSDLTALLVYPWPGDTNSD